MTLRRPSLPNQPYLIDSRRHIGALSELWLSEALWRVCLLQSAMFAYISRSISGDSRLALIRIHRHL